MTYNEIQELNGTQPYSFESDREEQWYKCGLVEGADVAYEQAEKDLMEKFKMWVAYNGYTAKDAEAVYNDFKQFIEEN